MQNCFQNPPSSKRGLSELQRQLSIQSDVRMVTPHTLESPEMELVVAKCRMSPVGRLLKESRRACQAQRIRTQKDKLASESK